MKLYLSSTVISAIMLAQPAFAEGDSDTGTTNVSLNPNYSFQYFIPKTKIVAQIKQRITKCEVKDDKLNINIISETSMKAGTKPDYKRVITINGKSSFLVNRSSRLTLNNDGTLKGFNGSATGQGGPVLSAVIQTAALGASLAVNPVIGAGNTLNTINNAKSKEKTVDRNTRIRVYIPECQKNIVAALKGLEEATTARKKIRNAIANGEAGTVMTEELTRIDKDIENLRKILTITSSVSLIPKDMTATKKIDPMTMNKEYKKWFKIKSEEILITDQDLVEKKYTIIDPGMTNISVIDFLKAEAKRENSLFDLPGIYGFKMEVTADNDALIATNGSNKIDKNILASVYDDKDFVYVHPIPAIAKFYACADDKCTKASTAKNTSAITETLLPQLSKLHNISTGGSIFASRTVSATFGPYGEPLTLEYTKGGGGAQIASVINAAGQAATTIDGASLQATQDEIARITAERELDRLLNEPNTDDEN